ncbi:MAG: ATP-binding protein [Pirellula sp.]|jgi:DNA polymerase-3 subunit delta'
MDWKSLLGHDRQRIWFQNAVTNQRLASTFLFVGPNAIGKRTFAKLLAQTLLCTSSNPSDFQPCGRCETCVQLHAGTHPDLIEIAKKPDKTALSIDQFIGDDEHRMREGLCYEIRMKPYSNRRKIAIIDDADTIGDEGANSLLKTLEEPPPGAVIILISTSLQRQLPTIRSRCQVVRFQPLSPDHLATLALRNQLVSDPEQADKIAKHAHGSLAEFSVYADEALRDFQQEMKTQLTYRPMDFVKFAKAVQGNMESVGTESQPRRERLKLLIDFAQQHFRDVMYVNLEKDPVLVDRTLRGIQRCLEAKEHVDRMVAPAALIEAWAADIASI